MKIRVASFHLLNNTRPLIRAAIVGPRKVSNPIDAAGFTYGTANPKMKPESVPHSGPSSAEVKPARRTLENVIATGVPRIGYVGINALVSTRATHTLVRAKNTVLVVYF